MRTRSKRHRIVPGLSCQAFRQDGDIEVRFFRASRRIKGTLTVDIDAWPDHPYDAWVYTEQLLENRFPDPDGASGCVVDAVCAVIDEVYKEKG